MSSTPQKHNTSPTVVHVHRNGTIDISQQHGGGGVDDDEIEFEQSLLRLRQLTQLDTFGVRGSGGDGDGVHDGIESQSRSPPRPSPLIAPSIMRTPPPPPLTARLVARPMHLTPSQLDQKQKQITKLDIELRAAKAREEALRETLRSSSAKLERTAEAEQIRKLQHASIARVEHQATLMMQRGVEEKSFARTARYKIKMREESTEVCVQK